MARPEANSAPTHPNHLHVQSEFETQLTNDQEYQSQVVQPRQNQQRSQPQPDPMQFAQCPPQNPQTIPVASMQPVPQVTIPGQYLQSNPPYMAHPIPTNYYFPPTHPSHLHVQSESHPQLTNDQVYHSQVHNVQNPPQNPQTIPVDSTQPVPQGTIPGQYLPTYPPYMGQPTQYPAQPIPSNYYFQPNTQPFTQPMQYVTVNYETQINPPVQQPIPAPVYMVQPPPYHRTASDAWTTGIFDCLDDPMNALVTLLFPCLTFGQIAEIVDNGNTSCLTSGLLYSALAFFIGFPCLLSCVYRTKLRSKYGLVESPAPDWITHFVCEYCALCQEYRELQNRAIPAIEWHGNQNVQQYQVVMVPPANQNMM